MVLHLEFTLTVNKNQFTEYITIYIGMMAKSRYTMQSAVGEITNKQTNKNTPKLETPNFAIQKEKKT